MAKKVKTARGAVIDFDLFKIKEQMQSKPTPHTVRLREEFIDARLKRRVRKTAAQISETYVSAPVPSEVNATGGVDKEMVEEAAILPAVPEEEIDDVSLEEALTPPSLDEPEEKPKPRKTVRRRKKEKSEEENTEE